MEQKALKIARITVGFLFASVFGLQIRPFIVEMELVNMSNVLIELKIQMLHSVTPLVQGATANIKLVSVPELTHQYGVFRCDVALFSERAFPDL